MTQANDELELYEKVEKLFNLRISSSGNDIGILFEGKREDEHVWMDYEVFLRLRQSIEALCDQYATQRAIAELKAARDSLRSFGVVEILDERISVLEASKGTTLHDVVNSTPKAQALVEEDLIKSAEEMEKTREASKESK